jgi:hypothetical protein
LTATWWSDLARTLDKLAQTNTDRVNSDQNRVTRQTHERFGDGVDSTVHQYCPTVFRITRLGPVGPRPRGHRCRNTADHSDRPVPRGTPATGGDNVDLPLEEPHPQPPWATVMIAESVDCGFRSATCVNTFGDHGAQPPPASPPASLSVSGVLRLVTNCGGLPGWGGGVGLAHVTWSPELSTGAVAAPGRPADRAAAASRSGVALNEQTAAASPSGPPATARSTGTPTPRPDRSR